MGMDEKITEFQGSLLLLSTMIGVTVLFLPRIFFSLGWALAIIAFIVIGKLSIFTMYLLCLTAIETKQENPSYFSVCASSIKQLGPVADLIISISCFFIATAYLNVITSIFASIIGPKTKEYVITIACSIIIFLIAVQRSLSNLKFISVILAASMCCVAGFLFYCLTLDHKNTTTKPFNNLYATGFSDLVLALSSQQNMPAIYSQLRNKTQKASLKTATYAVILAVSLYSILGIVGYLAFGKEARYDIMYILTNDNSEIRKMLLQKNELNRMLISGCSILFAVALIGSYAFQLHPARSSVSNLISIWASKNNLSKRSGFRILFTFSFISLSCIITCLKVKTKMILKFTSSTCCTSICYILPSVAYLSSNKNGFKLSTFAYLVVFLGIISMIF